MEKDEKINEWLLITGLLVLIALAKFSGIDYVVEMVVMLFVSGIFLEAIIEELSTAKSVLEKRFKEKTMLYLFSFGLLVYIIQTRGIVFTVETFATFFVGQTILEYIKKKMENGIS